ncbi:hypothetical protein SAMN05443999_10819 [Roseovarius azorensis]|uniref:Uncharacterized protein n=1 Tax=Roseovarius azorensis TaxID=1287727 RepID=A0A1H7SZZ9_9RHOB|nr:hypothetical protein SAMN05443999_10819 [Roseovarius azorensis]
MVDSGNVAKRNMTPDRRKSKDEEDGEAGQRPLSILYGSGREPYRSQQALYGGRQPESRDQRTVTTVPIGTRS